VARRMGADDPSGLLSRAEDVTHEAFLTAWRKLDEIPLDVG